MPKKQKKGGKKAPKVVEKLSGLEEPLSVSRRPVAQLVSAAVKAVFGVDVSDQEQLIGEKLELPRVESAGEWALPCFILMRSLKGKVRNPVELSEKLRTELLSRIEGGACPEVVSVESSGQYLNFRLDTGLLAGVVQAINSGNFLARRPSDGRERVMIEYSQPNTHKSFHVGHMRNVALGDCCVRLYEHLGFPVTAANYFGDEGAHIARCLWFLENTFLKHHSLDEVPMELRGAFLGRMYTLGTLALDLSELTTLPFPGLTAARVDSIAPHPANPNWHVVQLTVSHNTRKTVVCGGAGYEVGDMVCYAPLGCTFNKRLVEPRDMKGVVSEGVMVAYRELELPPPPPLQPMPAPAPVEEKKVEEKGDLEAVRARKKAARHQKKKPAKCNRIFILPLDILPGQLLTEYGRKPAVSPHLTVMEEHAKRHKEVRDMLLLMEKRDERIQKLWDITRTWSLDNFHAIYDWLDCRFDVDFFETEVSEPSRTIVNEFLEKGVLKYSDRAVGCDLQEYGLGFCLLLKSNGAGLYATKDIALARLKFEKFEVDRSIYVVDAAQQLHFKQVFKTLELMGFKQAKRCFHLAYGQVVLPGKEKMSSRKGTVINFLDLKQKLSQRVEQEFLNKYRAGQPQENKGCGARPVEVWPEEQILAARRAISVGTIKYGMLNTGTNNMIEFDLHQWTNKTGNTGPYLMYAYARICQIINKVGAVEAVPDYTLLAHPVERRILKALNRFWSVLARCALSFSPVVLCTYLYELSKLFSSWYELEQSSVKDAAPVLKKTRLEFINAIAAVLKCGLGLLGISVLERM